jgi:hypothetical protein
VINTLQLATRKNLIQMSLQWQMSLLIIDYQNLLLQYVDFRAKNFHCAVLLQKWRIT